VVVGASLIACAGRGPPTAVSYPLAGHQQRPAVGRRAAEPGRRRARTAPRCRPIYARGQCIRANPSVRGFSPPDKVLAEATGNLSAGFSPGDREGGVMGNDRRRLPGDSGRHSHRLQIDPAGDQNGFGDLIRRWVATQPPSEVGDDKPAASFVVHDLGGGRAR